MNKTREELARLSVVPVVPAITAYEQETADISQADGEALYCLAKNLGCTIEDLIR